MNAHTPGISRRAALGGMAALGAAGLLAACGNQSGPAAPMSAAPLKADGDITVFTYSGYFDPAVLERFTAKHGAKVTPIYYSDQDEAVKKLASNQSYDVVVLNSTNMPRVINAGLLRPIALDQFTNADQLSSFFRNPGYDPGAKYSVPYAVGATGLMWRTDRVTGMTGSFADLWNQPAADGHLYVLQDAATAMGMALLYRGHPANTADESQINDAAKALIDLKPRLGGISSSVSTNQDGQSWLTQGWSGDAFAYLNTPGAAPIQWQACKEGSLFSADLWTVAASSQHPGTASLFLDDMVSPDAVAANQATVGYPVPTASGLKAFQALTADHPYLAPNPSELNSDEEWIAPLTGERLKYVTTAWNKVLAS